MTWLNHAIFRKLVARRESCRPTRLFFFDLAPYIVIVFFPLPVGDPEELSQAFVLECLDPLSRSWTSHASRYDQLFIELELGTETDVALPYPLFTTVWPLLCAYFCVGGLD